MSQFVYDRMESPIGQLMLVSDGAALCGVYMEPHRDPKQEGWEQDPAALAVAREQLTEYFDGQRRVFDLPLAAEGTDFQKKVWKALRKIPFGKTLSYGGLATKIGQPSASRAVGAANGRNPISIIVPCHRVIGADGSLTGFGGGLDRKQWLLRHEAALMESQPKGD